MKYLRFFLILFLIPFMVLAEECDISNITITSMEQNSIEGNTEVISEPTFEDRNINLDLKMYDVNDSITYDLVIKNDSEEDYMIDEDTFKTDSDYIEYTLKTKDNTNVVKAKNSKEVSLIVTYKKEVEDDKLTNNKFNASNTLKLSLNTGEKEQPLDIITTDNIKEVKNPVTSVSSMMLISIILLTSIVILYILIKRRNKYIKYLLILLSMILIPSVYAICTCDIEVKSTIEIEKKPKLFDTVVGLTKEENACVTKYNGEVTDEVGKTVTASNVYFDKCADKRNIVFGGFCWQVIRTTETKGTKLIYNGELVDGKCESTREDHAGLVGYSDSYNTLDGELLYGNSFAYDSDSGVFTLIDTSLATWSDSTYENLLGKYTCRNRSNTCTLMYGINSYLDDNNAYMVEYRIDDTNYANIGKSPFNPKASLSRVGYMFKDNYNNTGGGQTIYGTIMYGSSFTYDTNTNMYTLAGNTQFFYNWRTAYNQLNYTHYTCWNYTGSCSTISYISFANSLYPTYYNLNDGKNINDMINEMLFVDDVNKYDSSAKTMIDVWYKDNFVEYTDKLENAVFCNARNIVDYGALNSNGGDIFDYPNYNVLFKNNRDVIDLTCLNITDQFSTNNDKAKLTYPIALVTAEEMRNIGDNTLRQTSVEYWTLSPSQKSSGDAGNKNVTYDGNLEDIGTSYPLGVRPVISLKYKSYVVSGTGSETDPWIIE